MKHQVFNGIDSMDMKECYFIIADGYMACFCNAGGDLNDQNFYENENIYSYGREPYDEQRIINPRLVGEYEV